MTLRTNGQGSLVDDDSLTSDAALADAAGLGVNKDKQNALAQQLALSAHLRTRSSPQGQVVNGVYLPPSPIDTALAAIDHIQGLTDSYNAKDQSNYLVNSREGMLANALRRLRKGASPANPLADNVSNPTSADPDDPLGGL